MDSRTEIRDGMSVTWHQPIEMDDGIVLCADVYRTIEDGRYPVILSHGVYAKGLAYSLGTVVVRGKSPSIQAGGTGLPASS